MDELAFTFSAELTTNSILKNLKKNQLTEPTETLNGWRQTDGWS